MTYEIPGTALTAVQQMANQANAAAEAAAPSMSTVVDGLKPGGASLPSVTEMLAPLQAAPVPIPGLDAVKKTLETAQANIGLYLSVAQAHITETIKSAVRDGTSQIPDPNALAGEVMPNLFAPLLQAQSFISGIVSNSLPSIAAALAAGGPNAMANAQAAAANVGSSLTSGINGLTNQAKGQISSIVAPLKAQTTALMTTGPLASLPSVSSVVSSVGVVQPDAYRTFRKLNTAIQIPQPLTTVADPSPVRTGNISEQNTSVQPTTADQRIPDDDIRKLKGVVLSCWEDIGTYVGAPAGATPDEIFKYYDKFYEGLITPEQSNTRRQARAIEKTKPDSVDRTAEENAIVKQYEDTRASLNSNPKYQHILYLRKLVLQATSYYDEAYAVWLKEGSKYSLQIPLQKIMGYIS